MLSTLNEKTIHLRCINVLLTVVYKYINGISPELMNEIFCLRQNHYNLRNLYVLATNIPRKKFMSNSIIYQTINLFVSNAPFIYPLKTSENILVFCFQGIGKGCIGNEWVNYGKHYPEMKDYPSQ